MPLRASSCRPNKERPNGDHGIPKWGSWNSRCASAAGMHGGSSASAMCSTVPISTGNRPSSMRLTRRAMRGNAAAKRRCGFAIRPAPPGFSEPNGPMWMSGRGAGYPAPPPQIPACGFPAPGSRRRSNAIVGLDATDPQARGFCDMLSPGTESGACVAAYLPFDRPPSLRHLRRRLRSALFDASTVLRSRPTPRLFLDSFVSSTSCRGPGSLKRPRARRGLPGSDAILPYVMWPQTPAGRRFLA